MSINPHTLRLVAGLMGAAAALVSCKPSPTAPVSGPDSQGQRLRISVSIPPQADFVRRIGGERVDVRAFVDASQDPHQFSATPSQVIALGDSDVFFSIGMPFETALLPKIASTLPNLLIADMAEGIDFEKPADLGHEDSHGHAGHNHGDSDSDNHSDGHDDHSDVEGDHPDHGENAAHPPGDDSHDHHGHDHDSDPHIWLSPPLILDIAQNIHDTLVGADPSGAALYAENLRVFKEEVDLLHTDLLFILEPCRGKSFYVYHPAFNHFARAYGLEERSIEVGGKSPSPKQLMNLIEDAKRDGARVIFVQPQFDPASAKLVADAIDGRVASINPLAEDVLANLRTIAQTIYGGLAAE